MTPAAVADRVRSIRPWKNLLKPAGEAPSGVHRGSPVGRFLGVVVRADSYRNIAYLLLGLLLGTFWFTVLVTAVSVAAGMLVVALVGVPMLVGVWYVSRAFANVGRGVANRLLHERVPFAPISSPHRGNPWRRLRAMSRERDRRRELGFLMARFPAGVATFTAAVTAISVPLLVAWVPIGARIGDHPFGDWVLSSSVEDLATSPWSWFLVPLGLLLLVVAFHLLNGLARACGRWAASRLGPGTP